MTPMGRLGRPDELNGLAVFLAGGASGFVTGAEVLADVSLAEWSGVDLFSRDGFVWGRGRGGEGFC